MCFCLLFRRDLAKAALRLGLLGAALGMFSELFYFRDYWLPPTTMGIGKVSPEDAIFGFSVTALSVMAYPLVRKQVLANADRPKRLHIYGLLLAGGLGLVVGSVFIFGINSIVATTFACLVVGYVMLRLRPDLLRAGLYAAGLNTLLALIIYIPLFTFWAPEFWNVYWLLNDTSLGIILPGNIPLVELWWYAASSFAAGVTYPFITGQRFVPAK